jgi:arginyl-tRNA---protein transferase
MNYSVVEYLGESNDGKCGYCKKTGNYNSTGNWAHTMNCFDYQSLINRNWRRSGQYCYLPKNSDTCCPMYTIKCDAMSFKLNRSHKKILKRMNKFLKDGVRDKNFSVNHDVAGISEVAKPVNEPSEVKLDDINVASISQENAVKPTSSQAPKMEEIKKVQEKKISFDSDKPSNPKKAKIIRLERKKQKLAAKGQTLADVKPKKRENVEKSLEDFLAEEPKDGKHRLEVSISFSCRVTLG